MPLGTAGGITVLDDAVSIDLIIDTNGYYIGGPAGTLNSGEPLEIVGNADPFDVLLGAHNTTTSASTNVTSTRGYIDGAPNGSGVRGIQARTTGANYGVRGDNSSTTNGAAGVFGVITTLAVPAPTFSTSAAGVRGEGGTGVYGATSRSGEEVSWASVKRPPATLVSMAIVEGGNEYMPMSPDTRMARRAGMDSVSADDLMQLRRAGVGEPVIQYFAGVAPLDQGRTGEARQGDVTYDSGDGTAYPVEPAYDGGSVSPYGYGYYPYDGGGYSSTSVVFIGGRPFLRHHFFHHRPFLHRHAFLGSRFAHRPFFPRRGFHRGLTPPRGSASLGSRMAFAATPGRVGPRFAGSRGQMPRGRGMSSSR